MNTEPAIQSVARPNKWPAKRPFLVIEALHRPARKANTSTKGWGEDSSNWMSFERPTLVDKVTPKHLAAASVIVDVLVANDILGHDGERDVSKALVKNRFVDTDAEQVTVHYMNKYRSQIQEAINLWAAKRNV